MRGKNSAQPRIREGPNSEVQNHEFGTFNLQNSSVSVHNVHFMAYAPLISLIMDNLGLRLRSGQEL